MVDMGELFRRFWFLRGVIAGIALARLVPEYTDLTRFEFLRAFHAIIISWDRIATWIGHLIGEMFRFPSLHANLVNALLFAFSIGAPSAYSYVRDIWLANSGTFARIVALSLGTTWFAMYVVGYLGLMTPWREALGDGTIAFQGAMFFMFFLGVALAYLFVLAIFKIEGFAKGIVICATFLATMEALYFLNAPILADWVRYQTEAVLPKEGRP